MRLGHMQLSMCPCGEELARQFEPLKKAHPALLLADRAKLEAVAERISALHQTLIVSQLDVSDPALVTLSVQLVVTALAVAVLGGALESVPYGPQPAE